MQNFVLSLPTRVIFGAGAVEAVGSETAAVGTHALVVTGSAFARRSGLVEHLLTSLSKSGVAVDVYEGLDVNPDVDAINAGGRIARQAGADLVIGMGGGSTMDAAKAIAVAATFEGTVWDFARAAANGQPAEITQALPIIQVPIIASTGSETNDSAVLFDSASRVKSPIRSPRLFARAAIIDPTLTFSVPAHYTAVGGMNIVSRMLESYLTGDEFAVSDRVAEGLFRAVMDSLPRAMSRGEDLDARTNLSWAAALASTVAQAGRGGATPVMAMAHPVSAHYGVEHGTVLAALWPSFMRYSLSNRLRLPQIGRFKRYALLGRQLFGVHETDDEVAAEIACHRFESWLRSTNMPASLRELGATTDDLPDLARQAVVVSGDGRRLPSGLTAEDIEHIYEGALR